MFGKGLILSMMKILEASFMLMMYFAESTTSLNEQCRGFPEIENCTCSGTIVDCTSVNLDSVPVIPVNTTELVLRDNVIPELRPIPHYKDLQLLDLSENVIETIDPATFSDLRNLAILLLQWNRLNFTELPKTIFDPLENLHILNIGDNFMWRSTDVYRDDLMTPLTNLEDLTMDGLRTPRRLGVGFSRLTSLRSLTILSKLRFVSNDTFTDLSLLPIETLRIWSGWLESIDSHAFTCFPMLKTLDLSYNPRLGFYAAAEAWPGLEFTEINSLIFNHSSHFDTDIITLNETFLVGLNRTNLTSIAIDANTIVTMEGVFSYYIYNLQYFSFSYNRLTQVASVVLDIARMQNLIYLDASHQSIRHNRTEREILAGIGVGTYLTEAFAMELDIDVEATLAELVAADPKLHRYVYKDTSDKYIRSEEDDSTDPEPLPFSVFVPLALPTTTEIVNLSASLSVSLTTLPLVVAFNTISLSYLDYSFNGLIELSNPVIIVNRSQQMMTFNLRGNGLAVVGDYYTDNTTNLAMQMEALLLGENNLGEVLGTKGAGIMGGMQNLKQLDLSANLIKFLPTWAFERFPKLEILDLSTNSLRLMEFDLLDIPELRSLDLSRNLLSHLHQHAVDIINSIGEQRLEEGNVLELRLLENPFVCSCENVEFLKWTQDTTKHSRGIDIVDYDLLLCDYYGDIKSFEELDDILQTLHRQCNITSILLITFIPSAFIALVVGLSIFGWRHKWDIKFWFLNLTIKRKAAQAEEDERNERYPYDVFVSYSEPLDTLRWVSHDLIPNMESCGESPKKLLIHDRDFIPGNPVTENIISAIKRSRKIMLVIDRAFIESNWCKYETHMAHHEAICRGRDIVIAVLLEPASVLLTDPNMYQTLKALLKKRTYIEWPRNAMLRAEFWQRLHKAVHEPIMRPLQCVCGRALDRKFQKEENWEYEFNNDIYDIS